MKDVLMHATYSNKARAIDMVGLRIGPKTKPGTGYCARNDFECQREEAYRQSEKVHEENRKKIRPDLPTRQGAVFFSPQDGYYCVDDPGQCKTGEDDRGRPEYDFGFGKDVLYAVDAKKIPCKCGVGDGAVSDEGFSHFYSKIRPEKHTSSIKDPKASSKKFWNEAEVFDWKDYNPYQTSEATGDPKHEIPEVWCPCVIPRSAIIRKFDKNHPLEEG